MSEFDELRELAQTVRGERSWATHEQFTPGATVGRWQVVSERQEYGCPVETICELFMEFPYGGEQRTAAYIAAASPNVVLALIERLEAAEAAVERVRALAEAAIAADAASLSRTFEGGTFGAWVDAEQILAALTAVVSALGVEEAGMGAREHGTGPRSDSGTQSGPGDHRDDEGRSGARDGGWGCLRCLGCWRACTRAFVLSATRSSSSDMDHCAATAT